MIAGSLEGILKPFEKGVVVVINFARFAVHHFFRADDIAAVALADALVAKADAKNWHVSTELADDIERYAGFVRGTRPGRNDDAFGGELADSGDVDLIVS